jgi:hypothetical protein
MKCDSIRLSKYRDRINMDTIRPLPIFLGITGPSFCLAPDAFTPPSKHMDKYTAEKVKNRVDLNFAYFISNYALIAAGTYCVVILLHPKMIIYSAIVYFLWKIHNVTVENNTPLIVIGVDIGRYLNVEIRTKLLYVITLWVVAFICLRPFLLATGLTFLMVAAHAMMRDPKQIEGSRLMSYKDDSDDSSGSEVMVEKIDSV